MIRNLKIALVDAISLFESKYPNGIVNLSNSINGKDDVYDIIRTDVYKEAAMSVMEPNIYTDNNIFSMQELDDLEDLCQTDEWSGTICSLIDCVEHNKEWRTLITFVADNGY